MTPLQILDTDTHISEGPRTWVDRLPAKWGDKVMHVAWEPSRGKEMWFIGDRPVKVAWDMAGYGGKGGLGADGLGPRTYAEVHPATYDARERAKLMDEWGVQTAVLYPNVAGFGMDPFLAVEDRALSAAHVSAYNDYQLEEWVGAAPGRYIPMMAVTYWDIPRAVAEVERLADKGFGGIVSTGAPQGHGLPPLRHESWDPLWSACQEAGLSVSFHSINGDVTELMNPELVSLESPLVTLIRGATQCFIDNAKQITDLLMSGILVRFPELKFMSVESGAGWVPFVLEALDTRFVKKQGYSQDLPEFGGMLPSDLFHRQVFVNYFFETLNDEQLNLMGVDNVLFESDFPHPGGIDYAKFGEQIDATAKLSDENRHKVLWGNAAALYQRALAVQHIT